MWGRGRSGLKERSDRIVKERRYETNAGRHRDIIDVPGVTETPQMAGSCATPGHKATSSESGIGRRLPS